MYLVRYCEVTRMGAYADVYLNDVVEVQGKLFDFFAQKFPDKDTEDFIETYMRSKTRKSIDESQAYVMTMDVQTLCVLSVVLQCTECRSNFQSAIKVLGKSVLWTS